MITLSQTSPESQTCHGTSLHSPHHHLVKRQPLSRPPLLNPQMAWGLVFIGAIALSLYQTGIWGQDILNPGGFSLLGRFLQASLQPELSLEFLQLTLEATLTTLAYAVCGTFLSVVLGIIGGIFTSEVWWLAVSQGSIERNPSQIWVSFRGLLAVPRAIHEMLWGLFFVNIWGLDPLVAILAIAIPFGAVVAKIFAEILDETPRQPLITLLNSGVAPLTAFLYTLIPQAFLNLLSYTFYRFECSIRSAAVLGIIGAGGLGYEIFLSLQSLRYQQLWTFFYALFILNGIVDFSSAWLRDRLGCSSRLDLNADHGSTSQRKLYQRDPLITLAGIGGALLIPFCFWYVHPDFTQLWSPRTGKLLVDAITVSFPPDISWGQLPELVRLSTQTLSMSILAIALAGMGGILLSFPATRNFFLPGPAFLTKDAIATGESLALSEF